MLHAPFRQQQQQPKKKKKLLHAPCPGIIKKILNIYLSTL